MKRKNECSNYKSKKVCLESRDFDKNAKSIFECLPVEIIGMIIQNPILSIKDKISLRSTNTTMKLLVDDRQRLEFINWQKKNGNKKLVGIQHFISNEFAPPILSTLMNEFENDVQLSQNDVDSHKILYGREALLKEFYKQAQSYFSNNLMKLFFTLSIFDAIKILSSDGLCEDSQFHSNLIFSNGEMNEAKLRINLTLNRLYFGIIWSDKSIDSFDFEKDCANFLILLQRMLQMRRISDEQIHNEGASNISKGRTTNSLINYLNPLDFGNKLVKIGNIVSFTNRMPKKFPEILLSIEITGEEATIESLKEYANNDSFDWKEFNYTDENLVKVRLKFVSKEARKLGCSPHYYLNY
ncbi:CLUMA_CG002316, isoform A [Clunio marinus]|uniref:CLUMA_CG002316, isoform A n=1 Tax=Clunio marinus TaxID=568069 RepID=A0A1J1HPU7_9DIPT|nr:CLUMA_CG002316, isoform A [Clunio marinus]